MLVAAFENGSDDLKNYFVLTTPCFVFPSSEPCRKPKRIPHGKYLGSSFKFKSKLRYACDKGYTLKGSRIRQCGEHGMWSKAPTCIKGIVDFKRKCWSKKLDVPVNAFM